MSSNNRHRIFISYSHKDRRWLEELLTHLAPFRDSIEVWADSQINAGEDWRQQISVALERAEVSILLITPDFLASDFLQDVEVPEILNASKQRGTLVLPILVRPCAWQLTQLAEYQFLNPPNKPLASLSSAARGAAYVQIVERLRSVLSQPRPQAVPQKSGQVASSELAEDIARKVFDLLKADVPGSPQPDRTAKEERKLEDQILVFVICSFSPDMEPVFEGIKAAAEKVGLDAKRVKDFVGDYQITSQIMSMIATARLIIADLTHERPNVYFELGYARGLGKTVITCAREGTNIHFDVKDWTYIPYHDSRILEKSLVDRFQFELEKGA